MPSLTRLSQTGEETPDSVVLSGRMMDPDLRGRILADWPDVRHETTGQKAGVRDPSERVTIAAGQDLILGSRRAL